MKTSPAVLAASVALLLLTLTATREAHALGPVDLEIAAKAGYGSQDLNFGIGGRAGVSFFGIYGGLNVMEYLGKSQTIPDAGSVTLHALQFGGEVGFGFKISFLTIRPLVGFGDMSFSGGGASTGSFYVEPGGLIQFSFGHLIFGVDAGCLILTNQSTVGSISGNSSVEEAFTIHGQVGVRF
jgi:hypothetical protein